MIVWRESSAYHQEMGCLCQVTTSLLKENIYQSYQEAVRVVVLPHFRE